MLNNVQIWVGGIWRRLIGQANRGGAALGERRRGTPRTRQQTERSQRGKAAPFCRVKVNLVATDNFGGKCKLCPLK